MLVKKKSGKHLTKTQKAEVKKIALAPIESKYVNTPLLNDNAAEIPLSCVAGFDWNSVIPSVAQGNGQNQRSGNEITNCKIRCKWRFWLNPGQIGTQNLKIRLYVLESKRIKSEILLNTAGVDIGKLLNRGDGVMVDWSPTGGVTSGQEAQQYSMMPINFDDFKVLKQKTFHLVKNVGNVQDDVVNGPNQNLHASADYDCSFTLPKLIFDNFVSTTGNVFATNRAIMFYVVAYPANSDPNIYADPTAQLLPQYSFRSDMFYKDA